MSTTVGKILTYYLVLSYLLKNLLHLLPLMFSWEIYEFFRSSMRRSVMEKAVLKIFATFTGKLQVCNFVKNKLQHRCFPLNIV